MSLEIELKAWIAAPDALAERAHALCRYEGTFKKSDVYWLPPRSSAGKLSSLRIREEERSSPEGESQRLYLATYKQKTYEEKFEVNEEREFQVSSGEALGDLLSLAGFTRGISKRKEGRLWKYPKTSGSSAPPEITVELSLVASLGWFVELEILAENQSDVPSAQSRILELLQLLGISEDRIENRSYAELLKEREYNGNNL